jgi:hypothetical protein
MRIVIGCARSIAASSGCATVIVAHTPKPSAASSKSFAGNPGAIRGGYAQVGTARVVATVFSAAKDDEKEWTLPGGYAGYVRVDVCKNNLGPLMTIWLKRELQPVGSERVAAVRHVDIKPKKTDGAPDLLTAFARIMATEGQFNKPVRLADLVDKVSELSPDDRTKLGAAGMPRKRWLAQAFGGEGVMEWETDYGRIVRSTGNGKSGTMFTLTTPAGTKATVEPDKSDEAECDDNDGKDVFSDLVG